jgi:hypothetical protein
MITKAKEKGLNLTFKQWTKRDYTIEKLKTQELTTRTEMCKKKMKKNIYDVNICKPEYENNMIRLWCKILLKIGLEQTKGNVVSYLFISMWWCSS